jgi:ribosomal protein S18 acetylase RimI-like enzyme
MRIREFDRDRDLSGVRECFIELQNVERSLDDRMPEGSAVADEYLKLLFERCEQYRGQLFVAESDGCIAGYVSVWARTRSDEPDDGPTEFAYISDFVVLPEYRRHGVARQLLARAEEYARSDGAVFLRLGVKGGNTTAYAFYAQAGFVEFSSQLEKKL